MAENRWYKTDNVAKVFLATHNRRDTRSLRISCTLNETVDGEILQKALLSAIKIRPQFQVRIRRGLFWHYLETTDIKPVVCEENDRPCPMLYGEDYTGILHYQVNFFGNRINLDMFHALADGTGALEFFNILLGQYLKLVHPNSLEKIHFGSGASAGDLTQDSFSQFYEKKSSPPSIPNKAYHFRGHKLPYEQLQFIEIKMPVSDILPKAKELGVSLSSYLGARWMLALYKSMPILKRKKPITISMPVNLRNYFPSETSRNFFNSVNISHIFVGDENLEVLSKEFDAKLKDNLKPEKIISQMDNYQKLERLIFVRMVPLVIKQPVVKYFSKSENKRVSLVLSNMGALKVPEEIKPYVNGYSAFCSHNEIFSVVNSYEGTLTLGVTYAYSDTELLKDFIRGLTKDGIAVTVNATEVVR